MWRALQHPRSRLRRHMLPPSLRLLVRHPARSVSLQLQRHLNSTDTRPHKLADFLSWARKNQAIHRPKRSQSRSGSGNAPSGSSLGKRGVKRAKKLDSSRLKPEKKNPSNSRTREKRISETVAKVVGKKKPPSPTLNGWSGENWKAHNWGLDSTSSAINVLHRRAN